MVNTDIRELARKYETKDFIVGDPSWFMHQVDSELDREVLAFVASSLSYGSRSQFMRKIQFLLDCSRQRCITFSEWVKSGAFKEDIPNDDARCFYRLYTFSTMYTMLSALQEMLVQYSSIKEYVVKSANGGGAVQMCDGKLSCIDAVKAIVTFFAEKGIEGIVPKNTQSSCKRICMFLRWMVRDNSPVDLGLWSDIIDKRTLIIPMDTHVLQEAGRLGLIKSKTASMTSAIRLTERLLEIFPDDPLKGDFALFGVGVDQEA